MDIWSEEGIRDAYTYRGPSESGIRTHADLSLAFRGITELIRRLVPEGRERSLCRTALEEAKMWASAGVARNPDSR